MVVTLLRLSARALVLPRSIMLLPILMAFLCAEGCWRTSRDNGTASQGVANNHSDPLRDENSNSWDIIAATALSPRRVSLYVPQQKRETALAVLRRTLQRHNLKSGYVSLSEKISVLQDAEIAYVEGGHRWPRYAIYVYDAERPLLEIIRFQRDAKDPSKCRHEPVEAGLACDLDGETAKNIRFLSQVTKDKSPKAAQALINMANRCD